MSSARVPSWCLAVLLVATLLGGWVRAAPIAERPLWYDEAYTWYVADDVGYISWLRWLSREPKHPPLSFIAAHASMKLFGSEAEWAVRLPSVACGILLIPAMFVLGVIVAGPQAGAMAALLTAAAPNLIDQGQQARMFSMLALLEVLALASSIILLERIRQRRVESEWHWVGVGLLLGAMLWTNQLALATWVGIPAGAAAWLVLDPAGRNEPGVVRHAASRLALAVLVASLTAYLGIASLARDVLRGSDTQAAGVAAAETASEIVGCAIELAGGPYAALLLYPLAIAGMFVIIRRSRIAFATLIAVATVAIAILFPMRQRHPFMAVRYLMACEPVIWLASAAALSAMLARSRSAALAALAVLLILAVSASVDMGHFGAGRHSVLPRVTAALAPHIAEGEVVVFHPEFDRVVGYYYGLPRKPPLQMALWHDRAVVDLDTLDLPRPATLWMIGVYEEPRSYTGLTLDEQGRQLEAFGAWYGHAAGGREAARQLQSGNTFAARFDESGVRIRVVEHPSEAARAIAELRGPQHQP